MGKHGTQWAKSKVERSRLNFVIIGITPEREHSLDVKFTTKSQEALSAAAMNASTAGNPQLEPAHLLKALMDQREGVAVALLRATGADPDAVSVQASSAIKSLPSSSGSSVQQAQLSRQSMQAIQAAQNEADKLGDSFVSTEHLLLGLSAGSDAVGKLMRDAGASHEALLAALPGVRGGTGTSTRRIRKTPSRPWRSSARTSLPWPVQANWIPSSGATARSDASCRF